MKYFKDKSGDVWGFDETDETQLPAMQKAKDAGWDDVTDVWPPAPPPITPKQQIAALETTVTARRLREAVLGIDNGWLKNMNDQIAALRAQLTKETTNG